MAAPVNTTPAKVSKILLVLTVVTAVIIIAGVFDMLTNFEKNDCDMTWMYQTPEYVPVKLSKKITLKYPKYGLKIYGEGPYVDNLRKMKVDGIPVLFIPGNAGSYKQVRSLASVSLRKSQASRATELFNYFTIDFNEEFSGLYGGVLLGQTDFVHNCIKKILNLYKDGPMKPTSVVLVGHSMGGILARALFTLKGFDRDMVHVIITQATPHQSPVLPVTSQLAGFYKKVNEYWHLHGNSTLSHVTVVSTGGGYRDILVRNDYTSLRGIVDSERSLSISTMSVPKAWVSTDHQCAVWCRQMVLVTKRALFDAVNSDTRQMHTDVQYKMAVFRHHFFRHEGSFFFSSSWKSEIKLKQDWKLRLRNSWHYLEDTVKHDSLLTIPLADVKGNKILAFSNVRESNWLCGCKLEPGDLVCSTCTNLASEGHIIPPYYSRNEQRYHSAKNEWSKRRMNKVLHLDVEDLSAYSHLIFIVPKASDRTDIRADVYSSASREISVPFPSLYSMITDYSKHILQKQGILTPSDGSFYYNISLPSLEGVLTAYTATLTPLKCDRSKDGVNDGSVMTLHVPWDHETHSFSRLGEIGNLSLKLQSSKPPGYPGSAHLLLYLHPACMYKLHMTPAPTEMAGQFVRFYGFLFPAYIVANLLMALLGQLKHLHAGSSCPSTAKALWDYGKPYQIIPALTIVRYLLSQPAVRELLRELQFPADDSFSLEAKGLWVPYLPPLLYTAGFMFVTLQLLIAQFGIKLMASIYGAFLQFVPGRQLFLGAARILQIPLAVGGIVLAATVCGGLGSLLCYTLYLIKVLRLSYISTDKVHRTKFHFHLTLLCLWMCLLVLEAPSLVVWAKNVEVSLRLSNDPSRLTATVVCSAFSVYFINDDPTVARSSFGYLIMIYVQVILLLLYAMESVYRIYYVAAAVLCLLAIPQLIGTIFGNGKQPKIKLS